ncbi:methylmalonyl-CoA mutase family protein [Brevibacillus reuszeri]|uniref:methylmalonyl-CoA mutase family protein n=1 Tax=Brevibacillus reuszeri TaxID=54915 RepID=UPI002899E6ED|nr:methylmalonyl-CoA mutase family protein [Brevibacillus reuszeri]
MKKDSLFTAFAVPTYEQWRAAAEKSLKGASFDAKLLTKTYEGITLQPIYRKEDTEKLPQMDELPGVAPFVRGTKAIEEKPTQSWHISQEIVANTAEAFNTAALHDLARGQTMVNIALDQAALRGLDPDEANSEEVGHRGLSLFCKKDVDAALQGIDLEKVPLYLEAGALGLPVLTLFLAHFEATGKDLSKLRGCIGQDPFAILLAEGRLPYSLETSYDAMAHTTRWASRHAPELKTILVGAQAYHNAGGNAVTELAYSLSAGVEFIQALLTRGLSIDEIAPRIQFSYAIGSDVFMEIAKLRAAKMLWSTIIASYGGSAESQKMTIHARTSAWTKTILDPYVNLLRSTTEAFSAVLGGVDSLHVSAFDEAIRPANEFSRRIARNTQIILEQEAHLAKVVDPAGGSWYVEWLTDALAQKAWELFLQTEEKGGLLDSLKASLPQNLIEQLAQAKSASIEQRKARIVGSNMYANVQESAPQQETLPAIQKDRINEVKSHRVGQDHDSLSKTLENLAASSDDLMPAAIKAALAGATLGDLFKVIRKSDQTETVIAPLRFHRAAESFEALRKHSAMHLEKTGSRPAVFLANMGPVSKHKARADFSAEFFAIGGFSVIREHHFQTPEEAAQSAVESGAAITVICSDDASYPAIVPPLAQAIKQANPQMLVLVAGLPEAEQLASYQAAGVEDCIHVRTNCYQMLRNLQERIGVIS